MRVVLEERHERLATCTFGFKPCVFGLRRDGQKMAFQMYI